MHPGVSDEGMEEGGGNLQTTPGVTDTEDNPDNWELRWIMETQV